MKHLLSSSAFLVLNKELARQIGLKESVLLADLISKEEYFIANGMTDGWFFNTEANIEQDTTLTPFQQRKCLKTLKKHQIVETKRRGVPAKQYFKINEQLVVKFLNNLSLTKCTTINKNKVITIHNKYFNKPTTFEVQDYCTSRNNNIDAEAFIEALLHEKDLFITPGTIFGAGGAGYVRFSLCVDKMIIKEAIERVKN